jgi:hypothetical protein
LTGDAVRACGNATVEVLQLPLGSKIPLSPAGVSLAFLATVARVTAQRSTEPTDVVVGFRGSGHLDHDIGGFSNVDGSTGQVASHACVFRGEMTRDLDPAQGRNRVRHLNGRDSTDLSLVRKNLRARILGTVGGGYDDRGACSFTPRDADDVSGSQSGKGLLRAVLASRTGGTPGTLLAAREFLSKACVLGEVS